MNLGVWFMEHPETKQGLFAARLGISREYLNKIVNKKARPSPDLAVLIKKETGDAVSVMELLYPNM